MGDGDDDQDSEDQQPVAADVVGICDRRLQ
jgi:hypothetical protein